MVSLDLKDDEEGVLALGRNIEAAFMQVGLALGRNFEAAFMQV